MPQVLPDSAHLWRRVKDDKNHLMWDDESHRYIPATAEALTFNPALSTAWGEHVQAHGEGPAALVERAPQYRLVFSVQVAMVKKLRLVPEHDPERFPPDPPVSCAHVSVYWPESEPGDPRSPLQRSSRKALRFDLASAVELIHGQVYTEPPSSNISNW